MCVFPGHLLNSLPMVCPLAQAEAWPVGPNGLLFDREWALVDDSSKVVTQKACPRMATLEPRIDVQSATLIITARESPGLKPLVVALDSKVVRTSRRASTHESGHVQDAMLETGLVRELVTVCGESVCGTLVSGGLLQSRSAFSLTECHKSAPCNLHLTLSVIFIIFLVFVM